MELKFGRGIEGTKGIAAFNRTIVELKFERTMERISDMDAFNRTIVELKLGSGDPGALMAVL